MTGYLFAIRLHFRVSFWFFTTNSYDIIHHLSSTKSNALHLHFDISLNLSIYTDAKCSILRKWYKWMPYDSMWHTHTHRTMVLHRATFFQANVRNVPRPKKNVGFHFGGIVLRVLSSQPANESKWWNPFARENLLSTFRDRIVERSQGHAANVRINLKLSSEKHMAMSQWELSFMLQQIRKSFLLLSHKLPEDGWNLVRFILPFPSCWLLLI